MTGLGVCYIVGRDVAAQAGKRPCGTRCMGCNKGGGEHVVVRSRLVVQETRHQSPDVQPGDASVRRIQSRRCASFSAA